MNLVERSSRFLAISRRHSHHRRGYAKHYPGVLHIGAKLTWAVKPTTCVVSVLTGMPLLVCYSNYGHLTVDT